MLPCVQLAGRRGSRSGVLWWLQVLAPSAVSGAPPKPCSRGRNRPGTRTTGVHVRYCKMKETPRKLMKTKGVKKIFYMVPALFAVDFVVKFRLRRVLI